MIKRRKPVSEPPDKRAYEQSGLYVTYDERALDNRTRTAKIIKELKRELQAYVGISTIASEILINRMFYKWKDK